jgi:hypothetical protein
MVQVIEPNEIAAVTDEWKMYMNQKVPDDWSQKGVHEDGQMSIDFY